MKKSIFTSLIVSGVVFTIMSCKKENYSLSNKTDLNQIELKQKLNSFLAKNDEIYLNIFSNIMTLPYLITYYYL